MKDPYGVVTKLSYDRFRNRTEASDSRGNTSLYGYDPVSYTHLDVYKRQGLKDNTDFRENELEQAIIDKLRCV